MILRDLLKDMEYECLQGSLEQEITALVYDSRKVEPGCAFVCLKGAKFDAHAFAGQAAGNGAAALKGSHGILPVIIAVGSVTSLDGTAAGEPDKAGV